MKQEQPKHTRKPLAAMIAASLALASGGAGALQVTGSFTGWWGQPQQENHGVIVSISRRGDGSNQGVLYWAHYDLSGRPSWLYAQGPIVGDTIEAELYRFDGVTFMQPNDPNTSRGVAVGSMEVQFADCATANVSFDSTEAGIGAGSFPIQRLTRQPGSSCSGGISDNRGSDAPVEEFRAPLLSTGVIPGANGKVDYDANPGRVELEVEIEDVPEGDYELHVGGVQRAVISVVMTDDDLEGEVEFRSPAEPGKLLLDFEPLGELVEIIQDGAVILEGVVEPASNSGPGNPGTPGGGNPPPFGDEQEIEVDLINDGVYPGGSGEAEYEQRPNRVEFEVEIEDIPVGAYSLFVDGIERGVIEVQFLDDDTEGELEFRYPPEAGKLPLDFDPRGALIEIFEDSASIFHVEFPTEGSDDDDDGPGNDDGGSPGNDDDDDDDNGNPGDDDDGGPDDDDGGSPGNDDDDDDDNGDPGNDDDGGPDDDGTSGELTVELDNTGVYPAGSGEASWERDDEGETDFEVEIEDVPVGDYTLRVGGIDRGTITVAIRDGDPEGEIEFGAPNDDTDELPLDFDPRGQLIEVLEGDTPIFSATLPEE